MSSFCIFKTHSASWNIPLSPLKAHNYNLKTIPRVHFGMLEDIYAYVNLMRRDSSKQAMQMLI